MVVLTVRRQALLALCTAISSCLTVTAIYVAPSSPCASLCGNVLESTSTSELVCSDSSFSGTQVGQTFTACINCELQSTYVDSASQVSDLQALLYNLRYATSACLFGIPGGVGIGNSQCVTGFACGAFKGALDTQNLSTSAAMYEYCSAWDSFSLSKCQGCVASLNTRFFLSNYFSYLDAACQLKPLPGSTLSVQGTLFATAAVTISAPSSTGSSTAMDTSSAGSLSLGARVGIAIGSIVACLILAGCIIVCRGRRKRRAYLQKLAADMQKRPSMSDRFQDFGAHDDNSPQSQSSRAFMMQQSYPWQQLGGQNDSPVSSMGEPVYLSPYSSNYTSPISPPTARGQLPLSSHSPAGGAGNGKGKAVATDADGRGEEFEMASLSGRERQNWEREAGWTGLTAATAPIIAVPKPSRERVASFGQAS